MKKFIALFLFLAIRASAQVDWPGDIDALKARLHATHPRFKDCELASRIDEQFSDLSKRTKSMSDAQVVVALQKIVAQVGDGHTAVWPFAMKTGILRKLPVMLWSFDDGIYVVAADDHSLVGKKVASIGGQPIDDVLKRIAPFVSHDNDMQLRWAAPFYATVTDFLEAAGIASSDIAFADGTKARLDASPIDPEKVDVKLVPPANPPRYLARRDEPFWSEEIRPKVLYVAVNSMRDGLDPFATSLRPQLAHADCAILDLRLNNGGEASKADELFRTFIAFDVRGGRLVTLISRMTFSAAQTFASRIDQWTGTTFIGEPTGSRPNHFGNERPFTLPSSGVRGTIASGWNQPVTARDDRDTIKPEVPVAMNAADYFSGRDPVLESALNYCR